MDDYLIKFESLLNSLPESFLGVLATSDGNEVGARTMSIIKFGDKFYFQTDRFSVKASHIDRHNQAAIAFDNYEIMGRCECLGHPLNKGNSSIMRVYKNQFQIAAAKYSHLEQEAFYVFIPEKIKKWEYIYNEATQTIADNINKTYICEKLGY